MIVVPGRIIRDDKVKVEKDRIKSLTDASKANIYSSEGFSHPQAYTPKNSTPPEKSTSEV